MGPNPDRHLHRGPRRRHWHTALGLKPVVMQHVGGLSSYGDPGIGLMLPSETWNFAFEQNKADVLAKEHFDAQFNLL